MGERQREGVRKEPVCSMPQLWFSVSLSCVSNAINQLRLISVPLKVCMCVMGTTVISAGSRVIEFWSENRVRRQVPQVQGS